MGIGTIGGPADGLVNWDIWSAYSRCDLDDCAISVLRGSSIGKVRRSPKNPTRARLRVTIWEDRLKDKYHSSDNLRRTWALRSFPHGKLFPDLDIPKNIGQQLTIPIFRVRSRRPLIHGFSKHRNYLLYLLISWRHHLSGK